MKNVLLYVISSFVGFYLSYSIVFFGEMPKKIGEGVHTFAGNEKLYALFPFALGLFFVHQIFKKLKK